MRLVVALILALALIPVANVSRTATDILPLAILFGVRLILTGWARVSHRLTLTSSGATIEGSNRTHQVPWEALHGVRPRSTAGRYWPCLRPTCW